jgi:hypothetical protein
MVNGGGGRKPEGRRQLGMFGRLAQIPDAHPWVWLCIELPPAGHDGPTECDS